MAVSEAGQSVTRLIRRLEADRSSAVGPLLDAYFDRLVQLARKRLQATPGLTAYEEDVALRSFHSLCVRVRDPNRPLEVASRDDFWRLLATRTIFRATDLMRRHKPQATLSEHDVEQFLSREPTPEEAAEVADECQRLLGLLDKPELRQVALWKVEGWTTEEIAAKLGCVPRTVERRLSRIRMLWRDELKELEP